MKISIKHIAFATLLNAGLAYGQNNQPELKTWSVGARLVHLYDLPSYKYDTETSRDMKGLNGDNTKFDLGVDLYVEKQFTPFWGVQVGFRTGGLTGANEVEYYENSFYEGTADLLFNLSNLDKRHMDSRWNYYARLGMGMGNFTSERYLTLDDSPNGNFDDNYWEGRVGAGLQYEINSSWRVELDVAYNLAFNDGFDGYNNSTGNDPYLSTGLGIAYTFGKKENNPMYGVNFFSPEYFGEPESAKVDNRPTAADSALANELTGAKSQMEEMNALIAKQEADLAELKAQKQKVEAPKTQREFVFFAFDSAILSEDAKRELAKTMAEVTGAIKVTGYADNTGDSSYNEKLKMRRAEAVKQFLVQGLQMSEESITVQLADEVKDLKNNEFLNRKVVVEFQQ
ncbi:outer membrane protein/peptidoglycan-associated (lipo)protein [Owenweeksia hongkongensis DSM 17368]|uniref:Outer membrane protein/peptidoglycan-associated (Lipo)protein n=1 Tax=Owenweeksia hongkongensis (strain DSM 17368 / CIP 108786 / JCM 12287 / NRRL B-23963 / UST20020801) TaxID=926562 RepID=G8R3I9_OWEHD|nr:OmpA family protein [Owenweeksia hongkongensis]AEV33045.1 outer membrane protein/peptidoglycan-associated (lipo)protein [Owenweeksia hongkongensis DSM 17368]